MDCSPQVGNHWPLLSQNSEEALWDWSDQGLPATPLGKYPLVPPTAKLIIKQNSVSNGAHLLGEQAQGFSLSEIPDLSQQLWSPWFTVRTLLVSLSKQVQRILSSQQRPQVWKASARVAPSTDFSAWVLAYWLVKKSDPQWRVEPKDSGPPPEALGYPTLPLLSMISISPLAGQVPYSWFLGRSQIAGQSQSPLGSLAFTSTLPYLKAKE